MSNRCSLRGVDYQLLVIAVDNLGGNGAYSSAFQWKYTMVKTIAW
jgi:hypothetical protein